MSTKLGSLLIVDDEVELLTALCEMLSEHGYDVAGYPSGEEALAALPGKDFHVLLSDIMMPGMDGITLLKSALEIDPNLVGIMMTGQGTIQTAVEAMKSGAFDYVLKPFKLADLIPVLNRGVGMRRLKLENMQLRDTVAIHELSEALAFSLDLKTILDTLVEAAVQQCDADESSVMLPTLDGDHLYVAAVGGKKRETILGERVKIGQGISGLVAMNREPLLLHERFDETRFIPVAPRRPDILSSISMPMLAGGKLIGVLNVNDTHRQRPLTLGQVKALSILAGFAATALEATELFTRIKEAEQKYRTLVEQLPAITYIASLNGGYRTLYISPQVGSMLGFSEEEWLTDPEIWKNRIHADDQEVVLGEIRKCRVPGDQFVSEYRMLTRNGHTVWVHDEAKVLSELSEYGVTLQGIMLDVTDRKAQEQVQRRLATAVEQAPDPVVITDVKGIIEYVNPAFLQFSGYGHDEVMGQQPWLLTDTNLDDAPHTKFRETLMKGKAWKGRVSGATKDGKSVQADLTISPVHDTSGKVVNYVGVGHDVTEQIELQRQFLQAQKMEAVGTLAGGIAHDFNNIIFAITGYTGLALESVPKNSQAHSDLQRVLSAGKRAGEMVKQILTFSRQAQPERKPLDLTPIIKEGLKFLRASIPSTIEIRQNVHPDLEKVYGDPTQIHQVLMNFCTNAAHAMRDTKGVLSVELTSEFLDADFAAGHLKVVPGRYVRLTVSDTGHGIPQEILDRIFEPFFTTKKAGEGTGLGLSVVHGIVKSHGGTVTVYSERDKGSTFNVYLPVFDEETQVEEASTMDFAPSGHERILFVDDEEPLAELGKAMLERLGYDVTTTTKPTNALEFFRSDPNRFDLVITDLTMPKMTGYELALQLKAIRADMPIIICSGFSQSLSEQQVKELDLAALVMKPILSDDLARNVRVALDRQAQKET